MGARGSRAPCLSLCLGFPQGWSRRGPRRIWGAPRSPARVSPGGPGTGSWRVPRRPQPAHKLGGSAHVAGPARGFRFCRPPTSSTRDSRQRRLLSPLSLPPKCSEGRVANTVVGPRRGGGGGPGRRTPPCPPLSQRARTCNCFYLDGAPSRPAAPKPPGVSLK